MAQVIGEIANNGITIVLKPKLDEAERQKAEAEAILKEDKTNAAALEQKRLANDVIKTYGQGSPNPISGASGYRRITRDCNR